MLAQSARSTTSIQTSTSSASPVSPSRPSRLRGLSYLRNYTQDRLLSARSDAPPLIRSVSSPNSVAGVPEAESERVITDQRLSNRGVAHETDTNAPTTTTIMDNDDMTRIQTVTTTQPVTTTSTDTTTAPTSSNAPKHEQNPTIRFIPHVEMRSSRPSLHFTAITKTLKNARGVIRVGRYTERDQSGDSDDTLPVGFKSKVVSRRHCEFWCTDGQWFVKDVKSSSGTFLNHVRLSSPGLESRPYPVNDGDVVQLGIDFKGGEEVIFRCVKIRIECNRGWQKALNNYNTTTHRKLLNSVAGKARRDSDTASVNNHECSICLNPVTPCQCLFVAPCSHVWHYKCVRNLVHGPNWPNFLCPNCRFVADLDADVEPPEEDLDGEVSSQEDEVKAGDTQQTPDPASSANHVTRDANDAVQEDQPATSPIDLDESADRTSDSDSASDARLEARLAADPSPGLSSAAATRPVPITSKTAHRRANSPRFIAMAPPATPETSVRFASVAGITPDHLLTPRNDAGPFILDGAAGRNEQVS